LEPKTNVYPTSVLAVSRDTLNIVLYRQFDAMCVNRKGTGEESVLFES
jgi:hypothetical protein